MSSLNLNPPPPPGPPSDPPGPPTPPPNYYQSLQPPRRRSTLTWVVIGGGAFFLFVMAVFTLVYLAVRGETKTASSSGFSSGFGDKIGVIDVEGVILEAKPTIDQLKKFEKDDSVKAIVLHIDSPGGGAAASQEIYMYVKRIADRHNKDKKKPIVAAISTVGASGAYYIASACNKIYSTDASIVGSIGVIAQWVNYGDLMKWAKLKDVTMKAGALKDAGNPARDMTEPERAYLQGLIDNMHEQFIHDVAVGRNMKEEDISAIADGRVWTGQQGLPLKLVDEIADFQDAIDKTAKSVGINGEPTIVKPDKDKKTLYDILFGDVSDFLPDKARMMSDHVGFYYLWK